MAKPVRKERKEIDKEALFNKIMPSAIRQQKSQETQSAPSWDATPGTPVIAAPAAPTAPVPPPAPAFDSAPQPEGYVIGGRSYNDDVPAEQPEVPPYIPPETQASFAPETQMAEPAPQYAPPPVQQAQPPQQYPAPAQPMQSPPPYASPAPLQAPQGGMPAYAGQTQPPVMPLAEGAPVPVHVMTDTQEPIPIQVVQKDMPIEGTKDALRSFLQPEAEEPSEPELEQQPVEPEEIHLSDYIAKQHLDDVLERLHGCTCEICRQEILSRALMQLPDDVITSDALTPELYADRQRVKAVVTSLAQSAFYVNAHPAH